MHFRQKNLCFVNVKFRIFLRQIIAFSKSPKTEDNLVLFSKYKLSKLPRTISNLQTCYRSPIRHVEVNMYTPVFLPRNSHVRLSFYPHTCSLLYGLVLPYVQPCMTYYTDLYCLLYGPVRSAHVVCTTRATCSSQLQSSLSHVCNLLCLPRAVSLPRTENKMTRNPRPDCLGAEIPLLQSVILLAQVFTHLC
jgi:hypothetical protein